MLTTSSCACFGARAVSSMSTAVRQGNRCEPLAGLSRLSAVNQRVARDLSRLACGRPDRLAHDLLNLRDRHGPALLAERKQGEPLAERVDKEVSALLLDFFNHAPRLLKTHGEGALRDTAGTREALALLETESHDTFNALLKGELGKEGRAMAVLLAAALDPREHGRFGITLDACARLDVDALREKIAQRDGRLQFLSGTEFALLRDYVHPHTGSFNGYRAMHFLPSMIGQPDAARPLLVMAHQFRAALRKLEPFASVRCTVYKGVAPNSLLDSLGEGSRLNICFPTSGTRCAQESYKLKKDLAMEIRVDDADAILVEGLHPLATVSQKEVILKERPKKVLSIEREEVRAPEGGSRSVKVFVLADAGSNPPPVRSF